MVGTLMVWLLQRQDTDGKVRTRRAFRDASLNQILPWWARERQSSDGGKDKPNICVSSCVAPPSQQFCGSYLICLRAVPLPAPTSVMTKV